MEDRREARVLVPKAGNALYVQSPGYAPRLLPRAAKDQVVSLSRPHLLRVRITGLRDDLDPDKPPWMRLCATESDGSMPIELTGYTWGWYFPSDKPGHFRIVHSVLHHEATAVGYCQAVVRIDRDCLLLLPHAGPWRLHLVLQSTSGMRPVLRLRDAPTVTMKKREEAFELRADAKRIQTVRELMLRDEQDRWR